MLLNSFNSLKIMTEVTKPEKTDTLEIRPLPWFENHGKLSLDQAVIEQTVRNLRLTHCPVCTGELSRKDNFGVSMPSFGSPENVEAIQRYCPKDNYIVELRAHHYHSDRKGATVHMVIYTNNMHVRTLANSGILANLDQVRLNP